MSFTSFVEVMQSKEVLYGVCDIVCDDGVLGNALVGFEHTFFCLVFVHLSSSLEISFGGS